jgi:hypothetical protein
VSQTVSLGGAPAPALGGAAPARGGAPRGEQFAALLHRATPVPELRGGARAADGWPNMAFRQRIAEAERSAEHAQGGYGLRNPRSGALGRYQMLPSTLQDLGWRNSAGAWTELAARHGVRSEADFLANQGAQETAMSMFLRRTETQLERNGAAARQGTTLRGIGGQDIALTEAGLVAAAHRRGAGMVARWLAHRSETPDAPLTAAQRSAFAQVERRLMDFGALAYQPMRVAPVPRGLAGAAAGPPAS